MTITQLSRRGFSISEIARTLSVTEGAVRYHRQRQAERAHDGRADQPHLAERCAEAIETWPVAQGEHGALNVAALHQHL